MEIKSFEITFDKVVTIVFYIVTKIIDFAHNYLLTTAATNEFRYEVILTYD